MVARRLAIRRRLLVLANVLLAVGVLTCGWASFWLPLDARAGGRPGAAARGAGPSASDAKTGPLAAYSVIYARPLRAPLYDPLPTPEVKASAPEPKLTVVLTGTIVEPGFSRALFRTRNGEEKLLAVGQSIEDAEVLDVADGAVKVRFRGREMTLTVQKETPP